MKAHRYDSVSKKYNGEANCQLDPIATKRTGKDEWLLPANCTWDAPLEPKEGYNVVWNGTAWEYQEIPVIPEPIPTPEEIKERKILALKTELDSTDYKIIKCSEYQLAGLELPYNIAELHLQRQTLRDKINELENE